MIDAGIIEVLFWLLVGHAVGDFALQTEWMVRSKNPSRRGPRSAGEHREWVWVHVLSAHALIHGGAVAAATGMVGLGIAETVAHWLIDYGKSRRLYGFHVDQGLHLLCKLVWAGIWLLAA